MTTIANANLNVVRLSIQSIYPGACKTKAFMNRIATAQIQQTAIVFECIVFGIGYNFDYM